MEVMDGLIHCKYIFFRQRAAPADRPCRVQRGQRGSSRSERDLHEGRLRVMAETKVYPRKSQCIFVRVRSTEYWHIHTPSSKLVS